MRPLLVLALALSACAEAQSPAPADASAEPIEVVDGRSQIASPAADPSAEWGARPAVQRAIAAAAAHWRGQDPTLEEDLRVLAVAAGAFTQPGASEHAVLYLVSRWPRCCPKVGIAVLDGDRLVRNVTVEGVTASLSAVPDVDGDGRDELALAGSFGMGGDESGSVTLVAFGPDRVVERGTVPTYQSSCGTGRPDASSTASRLWAEPGPTFVADRYVQASCEADTWTLVAEREPVSMRPPEQTAYVDLGVE